MIVPVKKLTVITLSDNELKLLETLGRAGVVQLRKLDENEFTGLKEASSRDIKEYESLLEKLSILRGKLDAASQQTKSGPDLDRIKTSPEKLREEIKEFEIEFSALEEKLLRNSSQLKTVIEAKSKLQVLALQKVDPGELGDFQHIFAEAGIVGTNSMPALGLAIGSRTDLMIKHGPLSPKETFLFVTGLTESKAWTDDLLTRNGFKQFKLPPGTPNRLDDATDWVDRETMLLQEELKSIEKTKASLQEEFNGEATRLDATINHSLHLSHAQSNLLRGEMLMVLQGWVPDDRIQILDASFEELNRKVGQSIEFSYEEPRPDEEIPTVMKNPKLFGAYETLTRQYGYPDSRESDPTIVSTILWTAMFGMMFADFGQGMVIVAMGAIFTFIVKNSMGINFRTLGKLMMGLGISSMLFGLLAGEFFLTEIHPLWPGLTPGWAKVSTNVIWLIKLSIFFGIFQITLGLILGIRNHLKNGEKLDAFLGERGVAGLITFLGIVLVSFEFLGLSVFPGSQFPEMRLNVLRHWTIAIPIAGVCLIMAKAVISGEGGAMGIGAVMETLVSSLANMLSYARIAGFCIAHAALALVVAELLQANPILGIGIGLIFLNVFALTLELMVVMIQALRLLYYEFSTKFFKGTGKPYVPYRTTV